MFCMRCGHKLEDQDRFCISCGLPVEENVVQTPAEQAVEQLVEQPADQFVEAPLGMTCAQCGADLEDQDRFCISCGLPVEVTETSTQVLPAVAARPTLAATPTVTANPPTFRVPPPTMPPKNRYLPVIIGSMVVIVLALVAVAVFVVLPSFGITLIDTGSGSAPPAVEQEADKDSGTLGAQGGDSGAVNPETGGTSGGSVTTPPPTDSGKKNEDTPADQQNPQNKGYIFFDSNQRYLSEKEIRALTDWERFIARNEIFARHGRGFQNQSLREYFTAQDWYVERYTPSEFDSMSSPLNDYERANSQLILSIEQSLGSPYAS